MKNFLFLLSLMLILLSPRALFADEGFGHMMGFSGSGIGWWWMWFGPLMMIGFWALVIFGIVWLARELSGKGKSGNNNDALDTLKKRYAKGEIDKSEFEKIKKDIN